MEERRKTHRDRTYLGGQIAFDDRCCIADCLVRNLSPGGAKIVFFVATIPDEFYFVIHQKGDSRRARFVWRRETEAGVAFLPAVAHTVVSLELARKIRRLEAQRQASRRVAELSEPTC